jgi:hypothetical protein
VTPWWEGLLLGALGAAVADGTRIASVMLASKRWPWRTPGQRAPFAVALMIRGGCAAALAGVVAIQEIVGWSDKPLVLFLLGLTAPTVLQHSIRLARVVAKAIIGEYFRGTGGGGEL